MSNHFLEWNKFVPRTHSPTTVCLWRDAISE